MAEKLDIFAILAALDKKDVDFYANLSAEEQKQIQPFVLMRWLSGTYNKRQIILLNQLVNPYLFVSSFPKEVLWYLLTICTSGKSQRYFWNKPQLGKSTAPIATKVIQQYFGYNRSDASDALKLLTSDDVIMMAEELGWQEDEVNKIRKEYGLTETKNETKPRKKTKKVTNVDLIEF